MNSGNENANRAAKLGCDTRQDMEYYNNRLCATVGDLNGIVSEGTLLKMCQRGTVERMRRGCFEREALYVVESMPSKYRVEVYRKYPESRQTTGTGYLLDEIRLDTVAVDFFERYMLQDGRHLTTDKQEEYVNNASILNRCGEILKAHADQRGKHGKPMLVGEFWRKAASALDRIEEMWPNSLPRNAKRLQQKFNDYTANGYEILVNGRFGNKTAAKVNDDIKESLIQELLADRRNLNNEQISMMYNLVAEKMGWKSITAGAVAVWREKLSLTVYAGRVGETKMRANKMMQIKRSRPTAPLLFWSADGWDAELLFQRTTVNKKTGHKTTTYHNRLTVVVILDTCCNYPIGYAIGEGENPALIKEALRNAVNHTRELFGKRYRTLQFQSDQYAIKTMTPVYGVIADKVTPARVKNAKAKPVEPYFGEINRNYCQMMKNWSGFGITSNRDLQPNIDLMNKYRHEFPDEEGCRKQLESIMELERQKKREQYMAMFGNLKPEQLLELSDEQYLLNFGEDTGRQNAIEGAGLRPTILGVKRDYDCFDARFREYEHVRWTVKYDPQDLQQVLAVNEDGSLRFMLEAKYVQPMALADRKEGDGEQLARVNQFNRELEAAITQRRAKAYDTLHEAFNGIPELNGTLHKLLLVDSDGQHKNQRNAKRLPKADEVEYEEVPAMATARQTDTDDYELTDLY